MADITQKLGFDAASAIASLRNLSDGLNQANANMRNLANSSREFTAKTQGMSAALASMGRNAQNISKMLTQLGYSAKTTGTSLAAVGNAGKSGFAAAMQRFDALAAKAKATAAATAAAAAKANAASSAGSGAGKVGGLNAALGSLASTAKGLVLDRAIRAFVSAVGPAIEEARKFGLAIAEIQTIAGDLGQSNDQISDSIMRLSNELGKSAKDVAEGFYQVLSNQVVEAADAMGFLEQAQQLAITTGATTAQSVDALSSVMNSYGLEAHEAARASDILFQTVYLGRLRLGDIADRIGRVLPMAAQMGVAFEEVGAAIAVMTVQGVKADTAITQLRAIMSKMMKPTEELTKIFKSWGVEDGEAAIRAFGGIEGVLRKLSQETGGSTAEMAEFFNVVRAMTGVMSVGTEEGQKFRDAIEQLENSTGKAADAWAIFSASPAQQLTVQINAAKNAMIEFGTAIGPIVTAFLSGFNTIFQNLGYTIEGIMSLFSKESLANSISKRVEQNRIESLKALVAHEAEVEEAAWKKKEQIFREGVANMTAAQNSSIKLLEAKQSATNEMFKAANGILVTEFEKSYEHLADFVNNATENMKKNIEDIKGLLKSASEIEFGIALDKAKTPAQKLSLLQGDYNKKLQDARRLAQDVGVDPERLEEAKKAYDDVRKAVSDLAAEQAKQGKTQKSFSTRKLGADAFREEAAMQDKVNKLSQERLPAATAELKSLEGQKTALQELFKQYENLAEQRSKFVGTDKQQAQLDESIAKVGMQILEMFQDIGKDGKLLDALGIENGLADLPAKFTEGFAKATIDWAVQTDSLRQALEALQVKILVDVGISEAAQKRLQAEGKGRLQGEGAGAYVDRTLQAGVKADKSQATSLDDLDKAGVNYNAALKESRVQLASIKTMVKSLAADITNTGEQTKSLFGESVIVNPFLALSKWVYGEKGIEDLVKEGEEVLKVRQKLEQFHTQAQQPGGLGAEGTKQFQEFSSSITQLREAGVISDELATAFTRLTLAIGQMNSNGKIITDSAQAGRAAAEELKKAEEVMDKVRETKVPVPKAALDGVKALGTEVKASQADLDTLEGKVGSTKQTMDLYLVSAGQAKTAVVATGTAQSGFVSTVGTAAQAIMGEVAAQQQLLDKVLATNAAKAAGGGAASTAYAGGLINYLAAGGRGMDQIPAMLAKGEMVVNAKSSGKFFSELNAMNNGSRPVHRAQGGSVTNVGDVNVTVKGGDSSQQTVREIGHSLRREIQRGTIKLK